MKSEFINAALNLPVTKYTGITRKTQDQVSCAEVCVHFCTMFGRPRYQQKQPQEVFCEKFVLKNFANFTGKQLCWSLFLIKLHAWRPAALLKRDSKTDVFLWNLQNFQEHWFWRTSATTASISNNESCSKLQRYLQP